MVEQGSGAHARGKEVPWTSCMDGHHPPLGDVCAASMSPSDPLGISTLHARVGDSGCAPVSPWLCETVSPVVVGFPGQPRSRS